MPNLGTDRLEAQLMDSWFTCTVTAWLSDRLTGGMRRCFQLLCCRAHWVFCCIRLSPPPAAQPHLASSCLWAVHRKRCACKKHYTDSDSVSSVILPKCSILNEVWKQKQHLGLHKNVYVQHAGFYFGASLSWNFSLIKSVMFPVNSISRTIQPEAQWQYWWIHISCVSVFEWESQWNQTSWEWSQI